MVFFRAGGVARPPYSSSSNSNSSNRSKPDQQQQLSSTGGNLELGELGQLTISNDNEFDVSEMIHRISGFCILESCNAFFCGCVFNVVVIEKRSNQQVTKFLSCHHQLQQISQMHKTWEAKYTLRSHFDGVRALGFHPTEPVLITASEDQTLKFWNLQKAVPAKKSAALDVEPLYTFRAHTGPVLSLAITPSGDMCFSGGLDATIRCWNMPSIQVDPYDSYCECMLGDQSFFLVQCWVLMTQRCIFPFSVTHFP